MSLNNRIYFRDRHEKNADVPVSVRVCTTSVTSPSSTLAEPVQRTPDRDVVPLYTISQPVDVSNDNGGVTTDSLVRGIFSSQL